jgi:hypothetical protein
LPVSQPNANAPVFHRGILTFSSPSTPPIDLFGDDCYFQGIAAPLEWPLGLYFKLREKIRFIPWVQRLLYYSESVRYALFSDLTRQMRSRASVVPGPPCGVALCTRIKDEAPVLTEWLEYYRAAGIDHFFIYESFSSDNFREVLRPWIDQGLVTLIADWPYVPVTPHAEEDCILRALNRFEWVGFLDVDEFLVLRDGSSIGDFLSRFPGRPAVGFHWIFYGSSGHKFPQCGPVIRTHTRRNTKFNRHIKVFVRPGQVTHCRNPHSWQYKGLGHAVSEAGAPAYGSFLMQADVRDGWIGHFHCKSEEEYLAKMRKKEACDVVAMRYQRRSEESLRKILVEWNQVEDLSVQNYYRQRCAKLGVPPVLLDLDQPAEGQLSSTRA